MESISKFKLLASTAAQKGLLTESNRLFDYLKLIDQSHELSIFRAKALLLAGYPTVAEKILRQVYAEDKNNEHAYFHIAICLIDQRKVGWVEILNDLKVSSFDPVIRGLLDGALKRVANIFLNYKG